jgi:hypothetical protein
MSRQWMQIALVGTILTIGGPVLAVAQSSQTKNDTYTWNGVTRKAANRPRPQKAFSFQDGSPASAVPVSRSTGDGEGSVGLSAHPADHRTCPQCRGLFVGSWSIGRSRRFSL